MAKKPPTKQHIDASRRKRMLRPTMNQIIHELDRGRLRPLRERVEEVVIKQRGLSAHTIRRLSALEDRVLQNWNDNQAALIDLLHRIVVLENKAK